MCSVFLVAGCGGPEQAAAPLPRMQHALAERLAARSELVADRLGSNDPCGARAEAVELRQDVTAAINAGRVPAELLEPLSSAVNDLVARIPRC